MNLNLKPPNNNITPENLQSDDYITKIMLTYFKFLAVGVPIYFTLSVGALITYKRYQIRKQFEEVFLDCSDQIHLEFKKNIIKPVIKNGVLYTSLSTGKEDLIELSKTIICKPDC